MSRDIGIVSWSVHKLLTNNMIKIYFAREKISILFKLETVEKQEIRFIVFSIVSNILSVPFTIWRNNFKTWNALK